MQAFINHFSHPKASHHSNGTIFPTAQLEIFFLEPDIVYFQDFLNLYINFIMYFILT
jgi:hypothetical protein